MTQALKVQCLTKDQIKSTMESWLGFLKMKDIKIIKQEAHPRFTKEMEDKYGITHITKFADYYTTWQATDIEGQQNFFFVVEATKYDKVFLNALIGYWELLEPHVKTTEYRYPVVWVCPAFTITPAIRMNHIPIIFTQCTYRFLPLIDIYIRLHIKGYEWGFTGNLRLIKKNSPEWKEMFSLIPQKPGKPDYLGISFANILDNDIDARIINANIDDLVVCDRIMYEESPYKEIYVRQVVPLEKELPNQYTSGIYSA
jgi:hypothetical protein